MIGDSLTIENLESIREAMSKIKAGDRSKFFEEYFTEVLARIAEHHHQKPKKTE
jgi:hypothetical protein